MQSKCHFCGDYSKNRYWYYTNFYKDFNRLLTSKLPVCMKHFHVLYSEYVINDHIPKEQIELVVIKRLEKELNIKNRLDT